MIALEHIALWTTQLERLKDFYVHHFDGVAGPRYETPSKDFASYFIAFAAGSRLEIMQMPSVPYLAASMMFTANSPASFTSPSPPIQPGKSISGPPRSKPPGALFLRDLT